jgi:hypothetical protein
LPQERYLFIDLYRAAVILLMLEGHVFRTFLRADLQQSDLFQYHEFLHGLSAPAFLFGAGLTFVIATRRRWQEYHRWGEPVARRLRRYLLIIALGLCMHLPYYSIRKIIIDGGRADLLQQFQSDVLLCIGAGLIILQGLVFFFKKEKRFYTAVSAMTVLVCFLTPLVWGFDFLTVLPLPAAQLLNGLHGSPFPLFPYAGFLFAGAFISWRFVSAVERGGQKRFALRGAVVGAGLMLIGVVFDLIPITVYPKYEFWLTSPEYFLIRVGALMFTVCGFWWAAERFGFKKRVWTVLGSESLFVYVSHLLILYGSAMNPRLNLQTILGHDLGYPAAAGMFLAMLGVLLGAASLWHYLRRSHLPVYRFAQLSVSGLFLLKLFTRDF